MMNIKLLKERIEGSDNRLYTSYQISEFHDDLAADKDFKQYPMKMNVVLVFYAASRSCPTYKNHMKQLCFCVSAVQLDTVSSDEQQLAFNYVFFFFLKERLNMLKLAEAVELISSFHNIIHTIRTNQVEGSQFMKLGTSLKVQSFKIS